MTDPFVQQVAAVLIELERQFPTERNVEPIDWVGYFARRAAAAIEAARQQSNAIIEIDESGNVSTPVWDAALGALRGTPR